MKKGKIMLSVCTSLLCIGMLAGCNGSNSADWKTVNEWIDGIYTNTSGWEGVSVECSYNRQYTDKYRELVVDNEDPYTSHYEYYSYEGSTTRDITIEFTSDENGKLFGHSEDYNYNECSSEEDMPYEVYKNYNYWSQDNQCVYIADSVRYNQHDRDGEYWTKAMVGTITRVPDDYSTAYSTDEVLSPFSVDMYRYYASYISSTISNYLTNVNQSNVTYATLNSNTLSWGVKSGYYYTYDLTLQVDKKNTINYLSITTTYETETQVGKQECVLKEIKQSSVKTPKWFDPLDYDVE